MKNRTFFALVILASLALTFTQCRKDDSQLDGESGRLTVRITDAPSDDAAIEGTFITFSTLKVDGKQVEGFNRQTVKVSDLQNGKTEVLFNGNVKTGRYSKVSLVLDFAADANGNAPGAYVLDKQGKKHNLNGTASQTTEVELNTSVDVTAGKQVSLVVDFDLRKVIARGNSVNNESNYSLVTGSELKSSIRLVAEDASGSLKGKVQGTLLTGKKVVVYAYRKGSFNHSSELQAQGSAQVRFAGAITSSMVEADGDYQLSFLEEGDYEIYLVSYEADAQGRMQVQGLLNASSLTGGIVLNNISIEAKASVVVNINITGILS